MPLSDKTLFAQLAESRIKEARALLRARKHSGAYYIAGYAIELALKAIICKNFKRYQWPSKKLTLDIHTHSLRDLLRVAGLAPALDAAGKADPLLDGNWQTVTDWSEQSRYEKHSKMDAEYLCGAIDDPQHGVLTWLRNHY